MKKLLSLALLSTLICFSVQAEEGVYSDGEITNCGRDETLICDLYGNLLVGVVKKYRKDGTLRHETPYKNGQIDGVKKYYHKDNSIFSRMDYIYFYISTYFAYLSNNRYQ
jgi:antitoxin component YwqK of YwqJK toxin-antitoxin module